jgi:hypothetical protein
MFGDDGSGVYGIGEADILRTAKQLGAATGIHHNVAPVQQQVGEVDPAAIAAAEQHFEDAEYAEPEPERHIDAELQPGTLAYALRRVKLAGTMKALGDAWKEAEQYQGGRALRHAYALRSAALVGTVEALDSLVRSWVEFHSDDDFRAAVVARRNKGFEA